MEIKLMLITDSHINESNQKIIFDVFQQVIKHCKEHDVNNLIHLGDVFDSRKGQPVSTLVIFNKILDELHKNNIILTSIVGNHDKLDQKASESFLEPFINHPALDLVNQASIRKYGNFNLGLVSYFNHQTQLGLIQDLEKEKNSGPVANILLLHSDIVGFKMSGTKISTEGINQEALNVWDKVYSGHYHDSSSSGNITYIGSCIQHNYGEAKVKGCHLLTVETFQDKSVEINLDLIPLEFPRYDTQYVNSYQELCTILESPKEQKSRICAELTSEEFSISFYELSRLKELGYELRINKIDSLHENDNLEDLGFDFSLNELLLHFCKEKEHDNFQELSTYLN